MPRFESETLLDRPQSNSSTADLEYEMTTAEVTMIVPDGRTRLARLLAEFDETYDLTKDREADFKVCELVLKSLKDAIKTELAELGVDKAHLDHPALKYLLDYTAGSQRRMTESDLVRFRAECPLLWEKYSSDVPVQTIRRLTGARWLKRKAT